MKKILLFFLVLVVNQIAIAQIVDDTTKNVYGAHTTLFTSESFIKNNVPNPYRNPDTTVYLREKYSRIDASNRQLQHLGFLGSSILDLGFDNPEEIGRTFGFTGYNPYFRTIDDIKYFDTKSPFMDVGVVFGGDNRSKIDFGFSRNVNENWNLGFDINRITADKQIASTGEGDRAVESVSFDLYAHYQNEESPYEVAFSLLSFKHEVADIGGVLVGDDPVRVDYFLFGDALTQLEDASTLDHRTRYHVYHQFRLGSGFQLYHQFDRTEQLYKYVDLSESDTTKYANFYPIFNINSDTTSEESIYSSTVNEAGIKGDIKGAFYRFYVKNRSLIYNTEYLFEEAKNETFVGGYLRFNWKDKFAVIGNGEVSNEGYFFLKGILSSDLIDLEYKSSRSAPSFQEQHYAGNHHTWSNSFKPVFSNTVKGQINLKKGGLSVSPGVSFTTINNFLFVNEDQLSSQSSDGIIISQIGGSIKLKFLEGMNLMRMKEGEAFHFENEFTVSNVSGNNDQIKIPTIRYAGRLFWRGQWWEDAVPIEIGADFYYRSSFFANSYDPVISRFYLQKELKLKNYFALDVFINMKIRNLTTFIKWTHLNQQPNDGYMTTPYFPGQQRIIDFGVRWLFYD